MLHGEVKLLQLPAGYQRRKAEPRRMTNSSSHPELLSHAVPLSPLRLRARPGQHLGGLPAAADPRTPGCALRGPAAGPCGSACRAAEPRPVAGRAPLPPLPARAGAGGWGRARPGTRAVCRQRGSRRASPPAERWGMPGGCRERSASTQRRPPARVPFASSPSHGCPLTSGASNLSRDCWK